MKSLIFHKQRQMFYMERGCGLTADVAEAWLYSEAEAMLHVKMHGKATFRLRQVAP